MKTQVTLLALALSASSGFAEEHKVKAGDVPKAALDAVGKKYPSGKQVGYAKEQEQGKTVYEVKVVDGARHIDIDLSPEGKIMTEEEVIANDALPETVKKALADSAKYGKWKLVRVEKVITEEKVDAPRYEVMVTHGKKRAEVVFDGTGKVTEEEEKKGGAED